MFEYLIMGVLYDSTLTGYDIKNTIEKKLGLFFKTSFGSLYPALKRLSEKGMLTSFENNNGERKRIFYSCTNSGKAEFLNWLSTPMEVKQGVQPNLAKAYFFDKLPKEISEKQISLYEQKNREYLLVLEEKEKMLLEFSQRENYYFMLSTLYYEIAVTRETIRWCEHIKNGKNLSEFIRAIPNKDCMQIAT